MIRLLSEFNSSTDAETILQLIKGEGNTIMVESPQYFLRFRHVLASLQVRAPIKT
jgi:hypothetical protein